MTLPLYVPPPGGIATGSPHPPRRRAGISTRAGPAVLDSVGGASRTPTSHAQSPPASPRPSSPPLRSLLVQRIFQETDIACVPIWLLKASAKALRSHIGFNSFKKKKDRGCSAEESREGGRWRPGAGAGAGRRTVSSARRRENPASRLPRRVFAARRGAGSACSAVEPAALRAAGRLARPRRIWASAGPLCAGCLQGPRGSGLLLGRTASVSRLHGRLPGHHCC